MIKAGIVGATGYAGVELVRLLQSHPQVEIAGISSVSYEGKSISEVYPNLYEICDDTLESEDKLIGKCDVIFASLPHGLSEKLAKKCVAAGVKLIDLGADFRLDSEEEYQKWYKKSYEEKDLHEKSVYVIPELMRAQYKGQPSVLHRSCRAESSRTTA